MASKSTESKKSKESLKRIDGKQDLLGGKFSFWSLLYLWFRGTTLIQGSFNYAYFQGTGYSQVIFPFVKRIYANNKEKFKTTLKENIEFYNTGPAFGITIITSLHLFMLQMGRPNSEAKTVKFALMGPLAGINDAIFNFGSQPLFAGIAASLSSGGSWTGFWFWMLVYNAFQFIIGIVITVVTYRSGEKFMNNLSSMMTAIVKISSMVGITIIAALAITYTNIHLGAKTTSVIVSEGSLAVKVTEFQAVLDQFIPMMLPILLVAFVYFMMKKRAWSIYKALIFLLLLGITGYVFGVLA